MTDQNITGSFNPLVEGLTFDSEKGLITAANSNWLVIQAKILRDILVGFNSLKCLNSDSALEDVGGIVGKGVFTQLLGQGYKPKEIPAVLELLINLGGWGKTQLQINVRGKSIHFIITKCIIAGDPEFKEALSHFIRGFLKGLAEKFFGVNAKWFETIHYPADQCRDSVWEFNLNQKKKKNT